MRLTIAYSKIKKGNLVLINNDTYQRETLSERPIRQPLILQFPERLYLNKIIALLDAWAFKDDEVLLRVFALINLDKWSDTDPYEQNSILNMSVYARATF